MKRAGAPSYPIEAVLISYTIIHGQNKFISTQLAIPWQRAMGETTLFVQEATATPKRKNNMVAHCKNEESKNFWELIKLSYKVSYKVAYKFH